MIVFCLGTYLKTMINCMSESCNQKQLVGVIMHSMNTDFDETDDSKISNIVAGRKNPPKYIINSAKKYNKDNYDELVRYYDANVIPLINPNKAILLERAIKRIIDEDESISWNTVIDVISGATKSSMYSCENNIGAFLAGTLLYVLIYTGNDGKITSVNSIDDAFFQNVDFISEKRNYELATITNAKYDADFDLTSIEAKKFCMEHECEIGLLPLCQIADYIDPYHNNVRKIFTDYKMCPGVVKEGILKAKKVAKLDFSNSGWIGESLNEIDKLIHQLKLAEQKEFLYDGGKYFHRAYQRYADKSINQYDTYIFSALINSKTLSKAASNQIKKTDLGGYIDQYLWIKKNCPRRRPKAPMDYLWELVNLECCTEEEMTFWVCKFVIESCHVIDDYRKQIGESSATNENSWDVGDSYWLLNTQEDLYFYALLQLYLIFYHEW